MQTSVFLARFYLALGRLLSKLGFRNMPGAKRLYRFAGHAFPIPTGIVLVKVQGSKMYVDSADKDIGTSLLTYGVYENYQTHLFKRFVKPGMVVVDVGANIGYYTLLAARLVGNKGTVYAFEPQPTGYELLCKSVLANGYRNVVTIQKALSNVNGQTRLYVDHNHIGVSSFARHSAEVYGGAVNSLDVETATLDGFLEVGGNDKVDILKIDVEGAEGLVLSGAKKVLERNRLVVFLEVIPEKLRLLDTNPIGLLTDLKGHGFELQFINEAEGRLETITNLGHFLREAEEQKMTRNILALPVVGRAFENMNKEVRQNEKV